MGKKRFVVQGLEVGLGGTWSHTCNPPPPPTSRVWGLGFRVWGPGAIKRLIYDSTYFSGPGRAP